MYMYTHQRPFIMNNFLSNKRNQVTENQKAGTGLAYIYINPSIFITLYAESNLRKCCFRDGQEWKHVLVDVSSSSPCLLAPFQLASSSPYRTDHLRLCERSSSTLCSLLYRVEPLILDFLSSLVKREVFELWSETSMFLEP